MNNINYRKEILKKIPQIKLYEDIPNEDVNNLIYTNKNTQITIIPKTYYNIDELKYIKNLTRIFNILKKHNKTYNIKIIINNRELINQANLLNYPNINLTIEYELHNYQKEEFLKEDSKLEELIKPIKEATLSPYEKFLAVYNIVKHFKEFKDNDKNKEEARYIRYILNNNYIVCYGYTNLLNVLLEKIGIPSMKTSVKVDISYDYCYEDECIPISLTSHTRNIIKLDDDKYNIHGIYIADSTWDNTLNNDFYQNAGITFDRKKEAFRLELLTNVDLLLDFHNFDEYQEKINFYLKRETNNNNSGRNLQEKSLFAYKRIYIEIMNILLNLDYSKYHEFYNKYQRKINQNNLNYKTLEQIYSNFLTDYASYIIPLTNQTINKDTLLDAIINVKRTINKISEDILEDLRYAIETINEEEGMLEFPYSYTYKKIKEEY